jgi:CRP/FNR family transcriptional regulator, cyclic AMP receptor protein
MDALAVLASTPLFRGIPAADLVPLKPALRLRTYTKGAFIFQEGDPGNVLYVVASGQIKIGRIGQGGTEVVFAMLSPGETFGELALFVDGAVRAADAQATETTECVTLTRDALMQFVDTHPRVMRRVIEVLIGYVRATDETFTETAFLDIPGRVSKKLLELAESHGQKTATGVRIRLRLTQRTLAGMVAASRENVNRALSRFEARGAISREAGYVTILRPEQLRGRIV